MEQKANVLRIEAQNLEPSTYLDCRMEPKVHATRTLKKKKISLHKSTLKKSHCIRVHYTLYSEASGPS